VFDDGVQRLEVGVVPYGGGASDGEVAARIGVLELGAHTVQNHLGHLVQQGRINTWQAGQTINLAQPLRLCALEVWLVRRRWALRELSVGSRAAVETGSTSAATGTGIGLELLGLELWDWNFWDWKSWDWKSCAMKNGTASDDSGIEASAGMNRSHLVRFGKVPPRVATSY
jgi:hypothetical protein